MKRKLIIGAVIFLAVILVTVGVLAIFPAQSLGQELLIAPVDMDKNLVLHFEGYHIKLIAWDSDKMKITESQFHRNLSKENVELSYKENLLIIESEGNTLSKATKSHIIHSQLWSSLMQFEKYFEYSREVWEHTYVDFFIYVPNGIAINTFSNGIMNTADDINFNNSSAIIE